ncbi:MAG: thiopurine S-methyltransferase [Verrucomicrobiales bacterium]|nr:thiopurine S-methyltransferase [Verrucomicrobiales bacterium]
MDWDYQYRIEQTPWDKGAPAPPLLEWLKIFPETVHGSILVPGSGYGHDVRALASLTQSKAIVGLDISDLATRLAKSFPRARNESYLTGDLFDLPANHHGAYDWVWEHTCFCAIDPDRRDAYVNAVHGALRPGGQLLAVFFLNPYDGEHFPNGGPPHGTNLEELANRFEDSGKFRVEESYTPRLAYEGREGLEQVMRMTKLV